jgi:glyoxylase-like metal-dependent hydrolase (beta-lactamase superfamily II)
MNKSQFLIFVGLLALLVVTADAQSQQIQRYEITQVTDDLYRAANNTHRTVFLVTDEGIILADPVNVEFSAWLRSELDERFDVPVRYVLYSHSHADHASGGASFSDTAVFVGHENMESAIAAFDPEIAADIRSPDVLYSDRMVVKLGGQSVELVHPGPAHSDDMSVLFFREQRVGFAVDYANVKRLPGQLQMYTFDQYASAIGAILTLDIDTVVIGHGNVGHREDLDEYLGFLRHLQAEVAAAIAEGQSLEEVQESVQLPEYSHWLSFDDRRANLVADAYAVVTREL